jgi:HK97 family phage major capsid protein
MSALAMGTLFPRELANEMFSKVKGHSSLAKMANQDAIPFVGKDYFVFSLDSDVSVVGEGAAKPAGDATVTSVTVKPIKVVYQSRVNDEFMYAAEERRMQYLSDFADGFAKKLAAGLDKMALHGVNPATGSASAVIGNNFIDYVAQATAITYNGSTPDANLESAIAVLEANEIAPSGIILSPIMRSAIGAMTNSADGFKYPGFQFGGVADLGGIPVDSNITVGSASGSNDRAVVGDFSAFKWGIAKDIPLEVIEYGNPDGGTYDLKQANQVLLRSEAWIGWGILDANAFCLVAKDGTPIVTG